MHRNVVSLASALALLIGAGSLLGMAQAHEGDKQCNVLLDGDGEPVKESDNDDIDHSNSHACGPGDEADASANISEEAPKAEGEEAQQQVANVPAAPLAVVEPLTVYFDSGSAQLSAGDEAEIRDFLVQLQATNPKGLSVVGFTDTSGSAALNEKLSKARASNVVASLIDAGISDSLITQNAVGEGTLAVETPDDTREPNNRRVVITPEY